MNRALAALTAGAFLTVVLGSLGAPDRAPAMAFGAVFAALSLLAFPWVQRRGHIAWSLLYVAVQLPLSFVTFTYDAGVGSTLLLVLLVSQCVVLRLPVPVIALVVATTPFVHVGMPLHSLPREGVGTLMSVLFGAVITELLLREQRTRHELAQAHGQLRDYAAQAERLATVQERNRVARDIHDGLGHSLTVVQMQVKAARAVLSADPGRADEVLAKAQEQAETALAEVRRSVAALREPRHVPPLPAALTALAEETSAAGIPTGVTISGEERALPDESREALFRAAQEGLTNVRKHSRATHAGLVLEFADGVVRVEVHDDGAGAAGTASEGFGLVGLRERAARLGGRLDLDTAPGEGCTLAMEVPG
ncbi:sensor histidine kinase [Pseudonocardia humida]|uniref:Sensor histidine kinase n=1 Tax=Pseudonocardia humida TaxID=2800819 RepID=A0ABT1A8N2_9PSEU|nr:sensor histidine kinase [Pseudonocardia humida]MCO1659401.1 sensor histidine kinase [Pseudonocardia humida]